MLMQESRMRSFSTDKSPAKVVTYLSHMLHAELLTVLLRVQQRSGASIYHHDEGGCPSPVACLWTAAVRMWANASRSLPPSADGQSSLVLQVWTLMNNKVSSTSQMGLFGGAL